jgi:tetratricopeptide (TPR) repeat protein
VNPRGADIEIPEGLAGLPERFTQREVSRIVGVAPNRLRYWQRLRLIRSRARWGERFYDFGDLVALRSIKSITENRIPARKLCRAVAVLRGGQAENQVSIGELHLFASGRQIVAISPGQGGLAIEPLTGQLLLPFHNPPDASKIRQMDSRGAEELFDFAILRESQPGGMDDAIRAYRRVIELRPEWFEPYVNLGCLYYELGKLENACQAFQYGIELSPQDAVAHFNLGCVLEELGELDKAIEHLERATELMPDHADARFNLASAYEKRGENRLALHHWILYLHHQPKGPAAEYARSRLERIRTRHTPQPPVPIRPE